MEVGGFPNSVADGLSTAEINGAAGKDSRFGETWLFEKGASGWYGAPSHQTGNPLPWLEVGDFESSVQDAGQNGGRRSAAFEWGATALEVVF